jgi:hypothetical protein
LPWYIGSGFVALCLLIGLVVGFSMSGRGRSVAKTDGAAKPETKSESQPEPKPEPGQKSTAQEDSPGQTIPQGDKPDVIAGEIKNREFNGYLQTGKIFGKTGDEIVLFLDPSRSSADISRNEDKVTDDLLAAVAGNAKDVAGMATSMYGFSKGLGTSIEGKSAAEMLHVVVLPREGLAVGGPIKSPARFSTASKQSIAALTKLFGPPSEKESWPGKVPSDLSISSPVFWWGKVGVAYGKDGRITHVFLRAPVQVSAPLPKLTTTCAASGNPATADVPTTSPASSRATATVEPGIPPGVPGQFAPRAKRIWGAALNHNGTLLALALDDGILIKEVTTGAILHTLHGRGNGPCEVAFSHKDTLLVSMNRHNQPDGVLRVWEIATERVRWPSSPEKGPVVDAFAMAPDESMLATAGLDLALWDMKSEEPSRTLRRARTAHVVATFPPGGKLSTPVVAVPRGYKAIAFSADGTALAAAVTFGIEIRYLKRPGPRSLVCLSQPRVTRIAFSVDGKTLLASQDETAGDAPGVGHYDSHGNHLPAEKSEPPTLTLWDLATRTQRWSRPTPGRVQAISGDGSAAAARASGPGITLWNAATGTAEHLCQESGSNPKWAALSWDGYRIAFPDPEQPTNVLIRSLTAERRQRDTPTHDSGDTNQY